MVIRLASAGVKACRPAVKPMPTAQHKLNRLIWAQEHMRWTREQWASVLLAMRQHLKSAQQITTFDAIEKLMNNMNPT